MEDRSLPAEEHEMGGLHHPGRPVVNRAGPMSSDAGMVFPGIPLSADGTGDPAPGHTFNGTQDKNLNEMEGYL